MPKNLMTGQVFMNLECQNWKFHQVGHFFIKYYTFFIKNCQKPNAWAKFTSQNVMPGQKLTPKIPNARAHTSIPTFITESPSLDRDTLYHLIDHIRIWDKLIIICIILVLMTSYANHQYTLSCLPLQNNSSSPRGFSFHGKKHLTLVYMGEQIYPPGSFLL